jgi:hypothetical protein
MQEIKKQKQQTYFKIIHTTKEHSIIRNCGIVLQYANGTVLDSRPIKLVNKVSTSGAL